VISVSYYRVVIYDTFVDIFCCFDVRSLQSNLAVNFHVFSMEMGALLEIGFTAHEYSSHS
jgi:hypothetical protein